MYRMTKEDFVREANSIHKDGIYSYEKFVYVNKKTKGIIHCNKHNIDFEQTPEKHLQGQGCPKCRYEKSARSKTHTTEWFVNKAKEIHGEKYDYSKSEYIKSNKKVEIICNEHGSFWMTPENHLHKTNPQGCPKCARNRTINGRKSTTENFICKAKEVHGDYYDYSKVNYTNNRTKVCIICPKHGEFWQEPSNHLMGYNCPVCANVLSKGEKEVYDLCCEVVGKENVKRRVKTIINRKQMKKLTYNEFVKRANELHNEEYDYEEDSYLKTKVKMWMTHKKCGHRFKQTPHNHLQGQGCLKCCYLTRKTDYSFLESAKERFGEKYSFPFIDEEYTNSHGKITIVCNECGNTFTKRAGDFITSEYGGCDCHKKKQKEFENNKIELVCEKHGVYYKYMKQLLNGDCKCQKCACSHNGDFKKLSFDYFNEHLKEKYPNISVVDKSEYVNTSTPMNFRCRKCGHTFNRTPSMFLYSELSNECPFCGKIELSLKKRKTTEQFKKEVNELYDGRYNVIGEYVSSNIKVSIKCNECGRIFDIEANSFLQGHGCPYHNINHSIEERKILEEIKTQCPNTISNDRKTLNGNELDIYIPDKNIAIEYDGLYWHSEIKKDKGYHLRKTEDCEKQGIRLLHIFEDEWLYKNNIVRSILNNSLDNTKNRIFARKCSLRLVNEQETMDFLNENDIDGYDKCNISFGLYYNNGLVCIMTFIETNQNDYELSRFCSSTDTSVIGGASKLFQHFITTYKPKSVTTYVNRRYFTGQMFEILSFECIGKTQPEFMYVVGDKRMNINKNENCYRIYDCGKKVYKWLNNNF